jgi:hypothetical protein
MTPSASIPSPNILTTSYSLLGDNQSTDSPRTANKENAVTASRWGAADKRIVQIESARAISIAGFVGGQKVQTKDAIFQFGTTPTNFASLMVVPLDGKPIKESSRLLLTVIGRVENQNMGWNDARDSVSDQWGNGPTLAEIVPVSIQFKSIKAKVVKALDGTGKAVRTLKGTSNGFEINTSTKAAWYEITTK